MDNFKAVYKILTALENSIMRKLYDTARGITELIP